MFLNFENVKIILNSTILVYQLVSWLVTHLLFCIFWANSAICITAPTNKQLNRLQSQSCFQALVIGWSVGLSVCWMVMHFMLLHYLTLFILLPLPNGARLILGPIQLVLEVSLHFFYVGISLAHDEVMDPLKCFVFYAVYYSIMPIS